MKWFKPSLKDRLLTHLELQSRQAAVDREAFREILTTQQESFLRMHGETTKLVEAVAASVNEQSKALNRYLDLTAAHGEPQVRLMTDAKEAWFERKLYEEDERLSKLAREGTYTDLPMADLLAEQDRIAADLTHLIREQ